MERLVAAYGNWTGFEFDIREGKFSTVGYPVQPRLKRIIQTISDWAGGDLQGLRIADLGCLEGQFALEAALLGAEVVGIEGREGPVKKAEFVRDLVGAKRATFFHDDVRNFSKEKYGEFDVIICSGILYHLDTPDVMAFIERMYEACRALVIVDTHVALKPRDKFTHRGVDYFGLRVTEHAESTSVLDRLARTWSSLDNTESFWLTRSSLYNLLANSGFTSCLEAEVPLMVGLGDRLTIVAMKGRALSFRTGEGTTLDRVLLPERVAARVSFVQQSLLQKSLTRARKLLHRLRAK